MKLFVKLRLLPEQSTVYGKVGHWGGKHGSHDARVGPTLNGCLDVIEIKSSADTKSFIFSRCPKQRVFNLLTST